MSTYIGLPEPEEVYEAILAIPTQIKPRLSILRETGAFSAIIEAVEDQYLRANGRKCEWSPLALRLLKQLLDQHPGVPPPQWRGAVLRRYAGPKAARQATPVNFIPKLHLYLVGA